MILLAVTTTHCEKEESGTKDCNGVEEGTAYLDFCDECVGGTTGKEPCVLEIDSYLNPALTYGKVKDIDGNIYKTIEIGVELEGGRVQLRREWMVWNLKTTRYNDGTIIPNITDNAEWSEQTTGAWCYNNNDETYNSLYGKLYNWYAVNTGKLCPSGWHIPTDAEWKELKDDLIASGVLSMNVSIELKSFSGWGDLFETTNSTGFAALPGGNRSGTNGGFILPSEDGSAYWWSASSFAGGINYWMTSTDNYLYNNDVIKSTGYSCRCIKDY